MLRRIIYISLILMLFSCGKNADEKTLSAVLSANIALSKGDCQSAINVLEANGRQTGDARYLKTLASAYACRARYSVVTFFASDIALSATPAPFGGSARYSTSQATVTGTLQADARFTDLQTAINILLYAGGLSSTTEPLASTRAAYFSASDAADINSQLAFMMLAQLGKYIQFYADAGTTGVKGSGASSNVCFSDYSNVPANVSTALSGYPGACQVTNSPHAQLDSADVTITAAVRRTRMCHGVVLLNGILDLLPSIIASAGGGDLSSIGSLTTNINTFKTALITAYPAVGTVATVVSQTNCENDPTITTATIESYFAIIFEALIE